MSTPEERVMTSLDSLGVAYEAIYIDPAHADTAVFCAQYGYTAEQSANTIVVASKKEPKQFAACLVLANTRLDVNKKATKLLGVSKASFATAEEMQALTGMQVGGVTPFSLPPGLPFYIDSRVMNVPWVIVGGGGRSLKIKIPPITFLSLGGQVIDGLAI
jgi:prolyl-tRNA editing enzyme YbaK/EbsC (Cys-tRNA(Pro) deacylase)